MLLDGVKHCLDEFVAEQVRLEAEFEGRMYGDLKKAVAEAVNSYLRPARERYAELSTDPAEVQRMLAVGADRARQTASETMVHVRERVGFLPTS